MESLDLPRCLRVTAGEAKIARDAFGPQTKTFASSGIIRVSWRGRPRDGIAVSADSLAHSSSVSDTSLLCTTSVFLQHASLFSSKHSKANEVKDSASVETERRVSDKRAQPPSD